MKRLRKYYLPGVISLIGIPLFLFYFFSQQEKEQRVMEIVMPNPSNQWYVDWYKDSRKVLLSRTQHFVSLIEYADNTRLIDSAFQRIKTIEAEEDSVNCYGFTQVDKIYYNDFVFMLDQCQVHDIRTYMLMNDTFLIYHYSPPPVQETTKEKNTWVGCGTREANYRLWKRKQDTIDRITRLAEFNKEIISYRILTGIGILCMLFFYFILPFMQKRKNKFTSP